MTLWYTRFKTCTYIRQSHVCGRWGVGSGKKSNQSQKMDDKRRMTWGYKSVLLTEPFIWHQTLSCNPTNQRICHFNPIFHLGGFTKGLASFEKETTSFSSNSNEDGWMDAMMVWHVLDLIKKNLQAHWADLTLNGSSLAICVMSFWICIQFFFPWQTLFPGFSLRFYKIYSIVYYMFA